jgi:hypothetical protein
MVTLKFACGHTLTTVMPPETAECPTCGDLRVSRVTAPPPRFRGTVSGPYAEYRELPPEAVRFTKE